MSLMSRRFSVSSSAAKCARSFTHSTSRCPARPRWTSSTVTLERKLFCWSPTSIVVKQRRLDLPVFMISAYGDQDTIATALEGGADKFLTKPVDFPKLKQDILAVMTDATGGTG